MNELKLNDKFCNIKSDYFLQKIFDKMVQIIAVKNRRKIYNILKRKYFLLIII